MKQSVVIAAAILGSFVIVGLGQAATVVDHETLLAQGAHSIVRTTAGSPCVSPLPPMAARVVRGGKASSPGRPFVVLNAWRFARTITQVSRVRRFYAAVCALRPPPQLPYVTTCPMWGVVYYLRFLYREHVLFRGHIEASICAVLVKGPPGSSRPFYVPTPGFWRQFARALWRHNLCRILAADHAQECRRGR